MRCAIIFNNCILYTDSSLVAILSLKKTRTKVKALIIVFNVFLLSVIGADGVCCLLFLKLPKGVVALYRLKTESSFDSAHFLSGYEGKCKNIHGHRWRVVAYVFSDELITDGVQKGMLIDFKDFKHILREETEALDHALIIEKGSLQDELFDMLIKNDFKIISLDFRPTAENLAKYFYDILKKRGLNISSVEVYETPDNCAQYSEKEEM